MAVLFDTQEDSAMTTTHNPQNLELSVTNLGPIAKAKIDLRPLTVFVGPSNTGKSYMAVLIYALHQFFNNLSRRRMMQLQSLDLSENDLSDLYAWGKEMFPDISSDILNAPIDDLLAWAKETFSDLETTEYGKIYSIELPESVAELIRTYLKTVTHLSEDLENEIARCFGIDKAKNLVRHKSDGETTFSLLHNTSRKIGQNDPFRCEVTVTGQGNKIDFLIPNKRSLQMDMDGILFLLWEWHYHWLKDMEFMEEGRKRICYERTFPD